MATEWKCVMTPMVRALINDLSTSQTYDDGRIHQLIVISAQLMKLEIDFAVVYTSNMRTLTISPDPVDNSDDAFINLVSMKAACLILEGELKNLAAGNIKVQDGPVTIDMAGSFIASKTLYDRLCEDLNKAKLAYVLGNMNEMKVIFSAYQSYYTNSPSIQFG